MLVLDKACLKFSFLINLGSRLLQSSLDFAFGSRLIVVVELLLFLLSRVKVKMWKIILFFFFFFFPANSLLVVGE